MAAGVNTVENSKKDRSCRKKKIILGIIVATSFLVLLGTKAWEKSTATTNNPYRLSEEDAQQFREVLEIYTGKEYTEEYDVLPVVHHGTEAWFIQLNERTPETVTLEAMSTLHFLRQRNAQQNQDNEERGLPNVHCICQVKVATKKRN